MVLPVFEELKAKTGYLSEGEGALIEQAYCFAMVQHAGQTRSSGEPYITHPLRVAIMVAEMFCDCATVVAALLHDVLEDSEVTYEEIVHIFGEEVAQLVDGLTKINQLNSIPHLEKQVKNFSKMILAISQDMRIILVKLVDRLHNMRTLDSLRIEKQRRIAQETLDIYVPMAAHLSLSFLKLELENLAFSVLYPLRYRVLKKEIENLIASSEQSVVQIENRLKQALISSRHFKSVEIEHIIRGVYETYVRLIRRNNSIKENIGLMTFRIILDDSDDCYSALGFIHRLFKPIPGKFKDYIAIPKVNGYQALHSVLLGSDGTILKIEICTQTMNYFAHYGIASYWMFQGKGYFSSLFYESKKNWLANLGDLQTYSSTYRDFLEGMKGNSGADKIYVFTPHGKILVLEQGSIVLDFAYALHSELGNTCVAAKINQHLVDIFTVLDNGAVVTIVNSPQASPDPQWLSLVRTSRARQKIKQFLKNLPQVELIALGKKLLTDTLSKLGYELALFRENYFQKLYSSSREVYCMLGKGNLLPMIVSYQLINILNGNFNKISILQNITGIPLKFSSCCYPIPGDRIGGYFTSNFNIDIHAYHCPVFKRLQHNPQLILETSWGVVDPSQKFHTVVSFEVLKKTEYLAAIKQVIEKGHGKILKIVFSKEYRGGYVFVTLDLLVTGVAHLEKIIKRLDQIPTVVEVTRKTYYYG